METGPAAAALNPAEPVPVTDPEALRARLKELWGRIPPDAIPTAQWVMRTGRLPEGYITKAEARELGWRPGGDLSRVAPGKMIGGDLFYNREGSLPEAPGRRYREADIGYRSGARNNMRLVFSNDGLVFLTDHYRKWVRLK